MRPRGRESRVVLSGPPGYGAPVSGRALVSAHGFSARYDLDHTTGLVSRESHELYGQSVAGRILVVPTAKGGTATGWRLLDLVSRGTAPAAMIFRATNPVMVQGAVLAGIAIMHRLEPDPLEVVATGDLLDLRPQDGRVERVRDMCR